MQSRGQSIVTSRCVPQQIAQIRSPLAGQNRFGGRFSQIGQLKRPSRRKSNRSA